jgi:adenylate kinase
VEIEHRTQWVINLDVADETIIQRLLLRGRADDTEETIRNRLVVYQEKTAPLIAYYQEQGKLQMIDGDHAPELVAESLRQLVTA